MPDESSKGPQGCPAGPPGEEGPPGRGLDFPEIVKTLSDLALVAMRHDAIAVRDTWTKDIIDAELKRRVPSA
jgi:hypothetical protein